MDLPEPQPKKWTVTFNATEAYVIEMVAMRLQIPVKDFIHDVMKQYVKSLGMGD